tara:strand:+ start:423 stop:968 length:546 start_codon:yes stop_codon:yes gene_type:complete
MGYIRPSEDYTSFPDERNNLYQPGMEKLHRQGPNNYYDDENVKHAGPGKDFFDLIQGKPVTFTDDGGSVTVGRDGMNIQGGKTGVSLTPNGISVDHKINKKTRIGGSLIKETQYDPYAAPTYAVTGTFSWGGPDPVKNFGGIQRLSKEPVIEEKRITGKEFKDQYLEDNFFSDPNFRSHPL